MSRLARLTNVIAQAVSGHAALRSDEGVPSWVRYHGELDDRLKIDIAPGSQPLLYEQQVA